MSYAQRKTEEDRNNRYEQLTNRRAQLQRNINEWMTAANSLSADSPAQAEKDDVATVKQAFKAFLSSAT